MTFACRDYQGRVVCFDSTGEEVSIAVKKAPAAAPISTTSDCNISERVMGLCTSEATHLKAALAIAACVMYIS